MGLKDSSVTEILKKIKGIEIDLPEPEPGEPPATPEQIEEIGRLTEKLIPDEKIIALGKWQAAHVIYKLKEADFLCSMITAGEDETPKHKPLLIVIIVSVFIFFALLIVSFLINKH